MGLHIVKEGEKDITPEARDALRIAANIGEITDEERDAISIKGDN